MTQKKSIRRNARVRNEEEKLITVNKIKYEQRGNECVRSGKRDERGKMRK